MRAPGRVSRRSGADVTTGARRLALRRWRTVTPPSSTRACTGLVRVNARPGSARSIGRRWRSYQIRAASLASCAARMRALAASTSPTCSHAALMSSSWESCTTRVPKPAATRWRGSRFRWCTQLSSGETGSPSRSTSSRCVSACQRPYSGAVTSGSGSSSTPRPRPVAALASSAGCAAYSSARFTKLASPRWKGSGYGSSQCSSRSISASSSGVRFARGTRSAPPSFSTPPRSGSVMPGTSEPGRRTSMSRVPTRVSTGLRPQEPDELLEVALGAGPEEPAVVVRHARRGRAVRVRGPGGERRVRRARRVLVQRRQPPRLEHGDEERVVADVLGEAPRAHDAREREVGVLVEDGLHPREHRAHVGRHELARRSRRASG